jgi:hypothetical protein
VSLWVSGVQGGVAVMEEALWRRMIVQEIPVVAVADCVLGQEAQGAIVSLSRKSGYCFEVNDSAELSSLQSGLR